MPTTLKGSFNVSVGENRDGGGMKKYCNAFPLDQIFN